MPFSYEATGYSCASFFEMLRDARNMKMFGNERQRRLMEGMDMKWLLEIMWDMYTSGLTEFTEEDAKVYQAVMWGMDMCQNGREI